MTDYHEQIRQRMGSRGRLATAEGEVLYRGSLPDGMARELRNRRVEGVQTEVLFTDANPTDLPLGANPRDEGVVSDSFTADVTGGFSPRLRSAYTFSQRLSEVGAIHAFRQHDLDPVPERITYEIEWFDRNPGVLGQVETLAEKELRDVDTEEIVGLLRGDGSLQVPGRDRAIERATSPTYESEKEAFAAVGSVDFRGALLGIVSVVHTSKAVGGSIQGALAEYPGFTIGFGRDEEDVTSMTTREQAEAFHEILSQDAEIDLEVKTPFWVLVFGDTRWEDNGGADGSLLEVAYDGERFVDDPSALPDWVGVQ